MIDIALCYVHVFGHSYIAERMMRYLLPKSSTITYNAAVGFQQAGNKINVLFSLLHVTMLSILRSPKDIIKAARNFSAPSSQTMVALSLLICSAALEPDAVFKFASHISNLHASLSEYDQSDVIRMTALPLLHSKDTYTAFGNKDHNDSTSSITSHLEASSSDHDSEHESIEETKKRLQNEKLRSSMDQTAAERKQSGSMNDVLATILCIDC